MELWGSLPSEKPVPEAPWGSLAPHTPAGRGDTEPIPGEHEESAAVGVSQDSADEPRTSLPPLCTGRAHVAGSARVPPLSVRPPGGHGSGACPWVSWVAEQEGSVEA